MPAVPRITRSDILAGAFQLLRERGWEAVSIRSVAKQLGCSTQPIMYNFAASEELMEALRQMADEYHSRFLFSPGAGHPMLNIGMNYIRFAHQEPQLFRFLFQSNRFSGADIGGLIADPANSELLGMVAGNAGISAEEASVLFRRMFIMAHGYASLFANNSMEYNEALCAEDLRQLFHPQFAPKEEKNEKTV